MVPPQPLGLIRCFRIPFSTNVERVSLAAGHKGLRIDWLDVDPDDRSPVEAVSGQPLVPVLVAGLAVGLSAIRATRARRREARAGKETSAVPEG